MNFERLCNKLLNSNPKIRFTGILNSRGSLIAHKSRADAASLLTDDEVKMSVHYTYDRWNRLQNLQHRLGKVRETVTKYDNVITITLIFENNLFLISADPNSNSRKIVSELWKLIDKKQVKPARKTAAKKKTTKRKPARKTAAKKKTTKRKPARKTAAKKKTTKRKPARKTAAKKKTTKRKPARKTAAKRTVRRPSRKNISKLKPKIDTLEKRVNSLYQKYKK
ncbi:hypothetical protein NsoK4_05710 [Nitrosopumilus sp. K4]|uniref:hypothetical protein n=1 Tax=Nitrosopumilus sp. K4 TaxID=2795383 RepID=UPI001BA5282F|nr:hypothetical protein [Nitrosopumilus sp. K4]QUC63959.1 hypothetical protein NsoK4_05710 [Nitrosopumilus sp. K4]